MPRYFFSIESPAQKAVDVQGEELTDDLAAHRAAQETALELTGTYVNAVVVVRSESCRIVTEAPVALPLN